MKYAADWISSQSNTKFNYKIVDLKGENRNTVNLLTTFTDLKFAAIISAVDLNQAYFAAQLYSSTTYRIPIYNTLASSTFFEKAGSGAKALNVFQTLPNEEDENRAIIDILIKLKWLYVSVVSSDDTFTQKAVESFLFMASYHRICIATRITLSSERNHTAYSEQLMGLLNYNKANIIVLFTLPHMTNKILKALGNDTSLHIVSGTNWRADLNSVKKSQCAANGSIILQYANTQHGNFSRKFLERNLDNYNTNKWFKEFWEETFDCKAAPFANPNDTRPNCTGFEVLKGRLDLDYSIVRPTIDAITSIACIVRCTAINKCRWCKDWKDRFYRCIMAHFRDFQKKCVCKYFKRILGIFSKKGRPKADGFTILNFNGKSYVDIGSWQINKTTGATYLDVNVTKIKFKHSKKPESFCYQPCTVGEIEKREANRGSCCYECVKCEAEEIACNGSCLTCPAHTTPNKNKTRCNQLQPRFVDQSIKPVTALKAGSILGISTNIAVTVMLWKYWDTKIVKATGRELIVAILIALYICFSSPLVFLIRPSTMICGIQRFIVGLSLTACYTPLMLKTNRIYRIFSASLQMKFKPSLVSIRSQILLCLGLFSVQLLLGVVWIAGNTPEILLHDLSNKRETAFVCKLESVSMVFNLIPCLILMAACTFYGFKTRNFPSNFNEAYSISITMYVSCFLWGIFIPLLFLFDAESSDAFGHVFLIAGFMIVVGFVTQIGLFANKIIRICQPEKIDSSANKSQFFFSRDDAGKESVFGKGSESATSQLPHSENTKSQRKREKYHPTVDRYTQFHNEAVGELRSRSGKTEKKRSGSF